MMLAMLILSFAAYAMSLPQDDKTRPRRQMPQKREATQGQKRAEKADEKKAEQEKKINIAQQAILDEEDSIPDSLLHPRWNVQRTMPITVEDLDQNATDLKRPDNIKQEVEYNDTIGYYLFGNKMAGTYVQAPLAMTYEEYAKWSEKQLLDKLFRAKNDAIFEAQGKEKFDFTDMHFDLGPAEKIFGPGGVRVTTQGTAELKFGATMKNTQNPSLPIKRRKTTTIDFDEKINMNMTAKVGDKVNMNLNYNTDATFDYDAQNMKLKYDGKEDEIIKLVEAGNVSFPSNSALVRGASSLFGLRTDMQFGKLKLQTVVSQKKSSSKSVSSKGGVQLTPFEINVAEYDENRHFFLSHYFHDHYDEGMKTLPNIMTGVTINRIEIWVTNTQGTTTNTRNIIALTDLGEPTAISNPYWYPSGINVPANGANDVYQTMTSIGAQSRKIDDVGAQLAGMTDLEGGTDYEKLEKARLLTSSEYYVNKSLGYVTLNAGVRTDQVLAVAFEYTYGGVTYQVGEFSSDVTDVNSVLFVKSLKNTSNHPRQGNWRLMMKNVYKIANTVQKEKFRLDVKFQSDTAGVYLSYIPERQVKSKTLIKLLGADRLDNNNKAHSNGYFDYVEGYTVRNGYVFFPAAEPFGEFMQKTLVENGVASKTAEKYSFTELYDSTKTVAKQIAEKNKYILTGQYKGSREGVISAGATNIPQGSVVVTAGGVTLTEGSDYSVDYASGEVTILNQSILAAGTDINVSLESNSDYSQTRKTMFGVNWEYDFTKDFQMSGTLQHLYEQALTTKVNMGSEPLNNTIWGVNINWKKESQWLTNVLDAIPFLHVTQPSNISFKGEFAQLIAGQSHGTQDNASYLDDFENTKSTIDVSTPSSWIISSVPSLFPESTDKTTLAGGYNRSLLAWYNIDPLFTRRSSSLTPAHIKSDLEQLSNHYVREVYVRELYPNRDQSSYNGATSTLSVLNLAYYPNERGPYNFNPNLNSDGTLPDPESRWGGMMRKLDTPDFEAANIEYIEFWMLDPFIYTRKEGNAKDYKGVLRIDLGEVSEDVLHDGKKFYESGMPVDGSEQYITTQWGKVPTPATENYAFATTDGSRERQDVGYNGLTDAEELNFQPYQDFVNAARSRVSTNVWDSIISKDVANDNYKYFRGSEFDAKKTSILERYKRINNPQGNSPDSKTRTESYDTSYKTTPDAEDINQDHTLNEYEKYFEYIVDIDPDELEVGKNYIVDKRVTSPKLRNGETSEATWYQFRIPIDNYGQRVGNISDFTSLRFMRMFMTGFKHPIVLRFGSLDLVRGEWRVYEQDLDNSSGTGRMDISAVNIEENNDKTPVNYTLPPGIQRAQDPTQPQLVESNEQALAMTVTELGTGQSKCVYKNATVDMRQYKRIQLFTHANAMDPNPTNLADHQLALFVRLGSDYKNNYYEYEIPLTLTPAGHYDQYSSQGCRAVWPEENMMDVALKVFTNLKKNRNKQKSLGMASYNQVYSEYDEDNPNNKISILGNPTLGEVKTMMIGVRNKAGEPKSGEVWVNELRLLEYDNSGGWAAQGNLNVQLSDFGTVNAQGKFVSQGFGGLEDGVAARSKDDKGSYSVTASLELGKFFPDAAKVTAPLYYSISQENSKPKYNPLDTDMLLKDALESADNHEKDSIESIAVTKTLNTNFSLSNVRVGVANKKHPTPVDPANFSFSYSHSHKHTSGETTVFENEDNWRGNLDYAWTPVYKAFEPFKKLKTKSKWMDMAKQFTLNWLPQNITFGSDINRSYYELQERDLESMENSSLPLTFSEQFLWNREFSIRWDFTKNIHMNFSSATHSEIEEPYTPVNKDLYADHYEAWKDSVWTSIKNLGTPLDYTQSFSLTFQSPLDKLPILDWTKMDASYKSNYNWVRGSDLENGTSLGNNITNNRDITLNGSFNFEKLYNHIPFLKKANERFNKDTRKTVKKETAKKTPAAKKNDPNAKAEAEAQEQKKGLPTNKKGFEKEITIMPDTVISVNHARKTKRIIVSAKTADGKSYPIKYKVKDDNTINIINKVDSAMNIKISVVAKEPLDDKSWYKALQVTSRLLMAVRNFSFTYHNKEAMSLSGFMPMAGKAFGQKQNNGYLAPGLGFAFGLEGEDFIGKARERDWLMHNDSVATPATVSNTNDLQLKMTLEPWKNFKIDLNASRSWTKAKSIQYMYEGMPTTQTGTFSMTTISIGTAFQSSGNANNGYYNKAFEKFCNSIADYQIHVTNLYEGLPFPDGSTRSGEVVDPSKEGDRVGQYSSDVLIPAFLSTYTSNGGGLDIFPSLAKLLPNWSLKFSGLSKLPWIRDHFKSVNLNHAYKSIYAVGSYSSFSTFQEYMNGLGFINDATTGNPVPNSMYNISTVSINEAFSPLLGLDFTFMNNMTLKAEYKSTRVLTLSTTSVQLNEATSRDIVLGWGYKWQNFKLFGGKNHRAVKNNKKSNDDDGNEKSAQNNQKSSARNNNAKGQVNHDLNLRCDFSYRQQAAISRDIASMTSAASSGNRALKISFIADYTLSKLITMSFYYDMQKNIPLLSSSSYPTTTQDFGLSLKFSLKR